MSSAEQFYLSHPKVSVRSNAAAVAVSLLFWPLLFFIPFSIFSIYDFEFELNFEVVLSTLDPYFDFFCSRDKSRERPLCVWRKRLFDALRVRLLTGPPTARLL